MSAVQLEPASGEAARTESRVITFRPYQREAVDQSLMALREHGSTLLHMATGLGKTIVMTGVAREVCDRGGRVLLLAHRVELLEQAREKFERHGLTCGIEMADQRVDRANLPQVTIASVQTLSQPSRLQTFACDAFALVLVDECHHSTATTYRRVLDYFRCGWRMGVSATPKRHDEVAMGEVFASEAYRYDLRDGTRDGWLAPLVQRIVRVESFDLSTVRTTAGDLNAGDVEIALMRDRVLHEVAAPLVELADARPTLVFMPSVAPAHALQPILAAHGRTAEALDGTSPPELRRAVIERYQRGETQFLLNCALFTEGFDAPQTACVAIARPTKSTPLYQQMVGRGTRLAPESGKRDCLVLDFVGQAGRHRLVSALDVLAGKPIDDALREMARELGEQQPDLTVTELIDAAQRALDEKRRSTIAVQANYETETVEPFSNTVVDAAAASILGCDASVARAGSGEPATQLQINILQRAGIKAEWARLTRPQASALVDGVMERRRRGLCTVKQARVLLNRGLNPDVSFELARLAIDQIAANRWRTPAALLADPRFRAPTSEVAA